MNKITYIRSRLPAFIRANLSVYLTIFVVNFFILLLSSAAFSQQNNSKKANLIHNYSRIFQSTNNVDINLMNYYYGIEPKITPAMTPLLSGYNFKADLIPGYNSWNNENSNFEYSDFLIGFNSQFAAAIKDFGISAHIYFHRSRLNADIVEQYTDLDPSYNIFDQYTGINLSAGYKFSDIFSLGINLSMSNYSYKAQYEYGFTDRRNTLCLSPGLDLIYTPLENFFVNVSLYISKNAQFEDGEFDKWLPFLMIKNPITIASLINDVITLTFQYTLYHYSQSPVQDTNEKGSSHRISCGMELWVIDTLSLSFQVSQYIFGTGGPCSSCEEAVSINTGINYDYKGYIFSLNYVILPMTPNTGDFGMRFELGFEISRF